MAAESGQLVQQPERAVHHVAKDNLGPYWVLTVHSRQRGGGYSENSSKYRRLNS